MSRSLHLLKFFLFFNVHYGLSSIYICKHAIVFSKRGQARDQQRGGEPSGVAGCCSGQGVRSRSDAGSGAPKATVFGGMDCTGTPKATVFEGMDCTGTGS